MNGDMGLLQCGTRSESGCGHVWDARPVWDALEPHIDYQRCRVAANAPMPTCPRCGSDAVTLNCNGGSFFVRDHWEPNRKAYLQFVRSVLEQGKKLVVLEVGVGFNSPGAIRYPMEQLAAARDSRVSVSATEP